MDKISIASCPSANNQSDVTNPLQVTGFEFFISRIPEISFFVKEVTLPSLNLGQADQATPFVNIPKPGDKIQYSTLSCRIMVDEEFKNYKSIFYWIKNIGFDKNWNQVRNWRIKQGDLKAKSSDKDLFTVSDATLVVKGKNMKTASKIILKDIWPTDLSGVTLSDESTETQYLYFDVTFCVKMFDFDD